MDPWKYYDITHRDHVVCNPTSVAKLDEIIELLDLGDSPRVLDIACGKGELLLRLAAVYGGGGDGPGFRGVGVDISPFHIADARAAAELRAPAAELELLHIDGADYQADPGTFDLASCLGASWIFKGHRGSLRALRAATKPGGQVLVGEPFWQSEPDPAYLAAADLERDEFGTHAENVAVGVEEGLTPLLALTSNGDDWDRYETLQWRASARYAAAHPEDPDVLEILDRQERARQAYLTWGRETLGWALYLFQRPFDG